MPRGPLALVLLSLLSACGTTSSASPDPPPVGQGGSSSITVTTAYHESRTGGYYTEGAIGEIRLRGTNGSVVATKTVDPGKAVTFANLDAGTYRIEPALRPCDGNCSYLDPRTDGCQRTIRLAKTLAVKVDFTVSSPCRITT